MYILEASICATQLLQFLKEVSTQNSARYYQELCMHLLQAVEQHRHLQQVLNAIAEWSMQVMLRRAISSELTASAGRAGAAWRAGPQWHCRWRARSL